jgi:hypothetical protein
VLAQHGREIHKGFAQARGHPAQHCLHDGRGRAELWLAWSSSILGKTGTSPSWGA